MSYQRLGRRTKDSSWQWMMIGIFLGMGCSLVMVLSANLFGFVEFTTGEDETPETVIATTEPNTNQTNPTQAPTIVTSVAVNTVSTFTPDPNGGVQATPSETPLSGGTNGADNTSTTDGTPASGGNATAVVGTQVVNTPPPVGAPTSVAPQELIAIASPLIPINGGTFRMGTTLEEGLAAVAECVNVFSGTCSEGLIEDSVPPHDVTLSPYQIEATEVSVAQYVAFLNYLIDSGVSERPHLSFCNGPCALTVSDINGENSDIEFIDGRYQPRLLGTEFDRSMYPITHVTWYGAQSYCNTLDRKLPTEAQWERAARGPNNFIYPWGNSWLDGVANTSRSGPEPDAITPIDSFAEGASGFGVINMAGNAAEWTRDWYSANYYQTSQPQDPLGPASGSAKVVRGGAWDAVPIFARAVHRVDVWEPGEVTATVGFRCVSE